MTLQVFFAKSIREHFEPCQVDYGSKTSFVILVTAVGGGFAFALFSFFFTDVFFLAVVVFFVFFLFTCGCEVPASSSMVLFLQKWFLRGPLSPS